MNENIEQLSEITDINLLSGLTDELKIILEKNNSGEQILPYTIQKRCSDALCSALKQMKDISKSNSM